MFLSIIKLTIASFLPVIASALFYHIEKRGGFDKIKYINKQIIIGIFFGIISIIGTEWGIPIDGVMVNCRDAAPLAAGLIFGGPAGIIAGLMGGIERWVAVAWGIGSFTRVACSVSTALAGFYAAFLRKVLFEDKKPTYGLALGCGFIMEVFHLNMVFITNIKDATRALFVIKICFVPMVIANSLSTMLSVIVVSLMAGKHIIEFYKGKKAPIFQTIQRWLLIVLTISFGISAWFFFVLQNNMAENNARNLAKNACNEVKKDISDASDTYMLYLTRIVSREIVSGYYDINKLAEKYELTDISVINTEGIIEESNNPEYIGFDMASGEQSAEFLCLLNGKKEFVQEYGPISQNENIYRKFAGVANRRGFVQIGYDADVFHGEVDNHVTNVANNRRIGYTGGVMVVDEDLNVISSTQGVDLSVDKITSRQLKYMRQNNGVIRRVLSDGNDYCIAFDYTEGYYVIAVYNMHDATESRDVSVYVSLFTMVLIFAVMYGLLYMLIKKIVVNQITQMAKSLSIISQGNLNEVVDVRSSEEFSSLSDDINTTVDTLKRYISEAAARIDAELRFAKSIQESSLPAVFPERDDFEIYATMKTAKEVGGDFYDFYFTGDKTLNFLIADVSGKGIPAAMFMMKAKSVLKSQTERGLSVDDVFTSGNNSLCSENSAGMFVTAWQGCLDLATGTVHFANAGHNLPAIKKKNGKFEFHKQKVNLVLAGMEDIPYSLNELQLEPGDTIFLYTDGVTEATNAENELYGDDRLLNALNSREYSNPQEICDAIYEDIDKFVKEADQFDDITMLCLTYKAPYSVE